MPIIASRPLGTALCQKDSTDNQYSRKAPGPPAIAGALAPSVVTAPAAPPAASSMPRRLTEMRGVRVDEWSAVFDMCSPGDGRARLLKCAGEARVPEIEDAAKSRRAILPGRGMGWSGRS